jgi:putative hydrolase of the HAD superfamily
VSEEAGVSKPDPRIFEMALERANARAGEAVMVGDSWANDVEGARAAGIRAVWFNRDGRLAPDPAVPVLRSLAPSVETWRVIFGEAM